jgi:cytochrome c oxidase cbb3-type subunit III
MRPLGQVLLTILAALNVGCAHAPGYPGNPIVRPDAVADFGTLYSENCAACHGANGQGGPAIDLANPEYQALVDDTTLRKWISGGMPGTEMPAFAQSAGGMLTDPQVDALIAGMRRAWSQPDVFAQAAAPPYAQTHTGDAHGGEQTFQARCSACHAPLHQQIISPNYLALVSDQALRSVIIAGRPDIGQPDWSHVGSAGKGTPLSAQDVDNLVAYFASLRIPAPAAQTAMSVPKQPAPTTPTARENP